VVDLTKSRFKLYHAHIYLYDAEQANLVLAAGAGKAGQQMKAERRTIALSNTRSLVARAGRSRTGVIENNVTQSPDFLPNPYLPDTRAELAIPMIVGDQLVGVLDIQSEFADRFAESDLSVMTTLAGQIAVAVQNALSYQQQVQLVDQLQTVDKLKSEFLASMSHELRTPLNSIIGYSRMLLDGADGELEEEMTEDMEAIHNSGQHLLHLINDILDLAKIEAERLEIDPETVDFCVVAEEVTRMTSVLVQDKPVELVLDIEEQLPTLWADPIRLRQILNNLVSNAIKFTEQGEIRIKANFVDNMAVIGVHDTGMGISPDQLERVFERFHQADSSSTRKAGGTGLGLTITRHLVELHGGKIWAESTMGEGTTFWFDIPTTVGMN
jgi:signal transduction histidine kinase